MFPFVFITQWQIAMMESWMHSMQYAANFWQEWDKFRQTLMENPAYSEVRWHNVIPRGVNLTDGYGKRHHDVDVERI